MKSTLYLKFIIIYIIFGFLSLFTVAALPSGLVNAPLTKGISSAIYKDANMVATNYLPEYFSGQTSLNNVHMQLSGMEQHLNAAIWFVDSDGTMITLHNPMIFHQPPTMLLILIRQKAEMNNIRSVITTAILTKM